jgi:archaellum biogenesis ATPase FlaH
MKLEFASPVLLKAISLMYTQAKAASSNEEFNYDVQLLLLRTMMSDSDVYARSQNIINPDFFDDVLRPAARFIKEYTDKYAKVPSPEIVYANTRTDVQLFPHAKQHSDWYLQTIEKFCQYRALELAVLNGLELIQNGEGAKLEAMVKEAMTISLMTDLGTSYFLDPAMRLERLNENSNFMKTGWDILDKKLGGGLAVQGLHIFAGGSGSGKSLFLQNLALTWALDGKNVVYITLELSEDFAAVRLDSMLTGLGTKAVRTNISDAALKIVMTGKKQKAGDLRIKKFPEGGTNCNTIRAFLKEYEIKEGFKPDVILIDYLDLLHPNNAKINPSDAFVKDKYVSEEMRSIAFDWNCPVVTASQLNRQSVDAPEYDHSHIAGGISKINTADNLFGIITSKTMKERGEFRLQFLKCRSAPCVGQTITLAFDQLSMRISNWTQGPMDDDDDFLPAEQAAEHDRRLTGLRESLRHGSSVGESPVIESRTVAPGQRISEAAHPAQTPRVQIEQEVASRIPEPALAAANPVRANIMDLINKTRNGNQ